jgi:hypothetical protein
MLFSPGQDGQRGEDGQPGSDASGGAPSAGDFWCVFVEKKLILICF